jgi:hypothetical protein
MIRRVFLAQAFLPVLLKGDAAADAWDFIAAMAAALAEDNASGFLKRVDEKMPGFGELSRNVNGMLQQANVQSEISPLANDGNDTARSLQLDWELRMKPKALIGPLGTDLNSHSGAEPLVQREEAITVELRRDGKKWKVAKLEPIGFFAPPNFQ